MRSLLWKLYLSCCRKYEYLMMFVAIFISCTILALLLIMQNRLNHGIEHHGQSLLGAQAVVFSDQGMPDQWLKLAKENRLNYQHTYQWITMTGIGQQLLLITVHAIPSDYPLIGQLQTIMPKGIESKTPKPGQIWITPSIHDRLGVNIGQSLPIGKTSLLITAIANNTPFQITSYRSVFAPTVYINTQDLNKTGLFQPGAQVNQQLYLSGRPQQVKKTINQIRPILQPGQKITTTASLNNLKNTLNQSTRILALLSWIGLIFAAVIIALASEQFFNRQRQTIALLCSYGVSKGKILLTFALLCSSSAILGVISGSLTAWFLQFPLQSILPLWIGTSLPIQPWYLVTWQPILMGLCLTVAFMAPPLIHLSSVSPMECFKTGPVTLAHQHQYYWLSLIVLVALLFELTGVRLGSTFLIFMIEIVAALFLIATCLLHCTRFICHRVSVIKLCWLRFLQRYWPHHSLQLIGIGLTTSLCFLWLLCQQGLTQQWHNQLPEKTPNIFIINVMPTQQQKLQTWFMKHNIPTPTIYPAVRGRLKLLNQQPIRQAIRPEAVNHNTLRRSLNLSEGLDLPKGNVITSGTWPDQNNPQIPEVSVEQGFAIDLGLKLGDVMTFAINQDTLSATITSIRKLNWMTFTPNFYCFFPQGTLSNFNRTLFASFYLDNNNKNNILTDLHRTLPTITILDLEQIFAEIKNISSNVMSWLKYLLILLFILSLVVYIQCMISQRQQRIADMKILSKIGATEKQIRGGFFFEQISVSTTAIVCGLVFTQILSYWFLNILLNLEITFKPTLFLTTLVSFLVINFIIVTSYYYFCRRKTLQPNT